MKFRSPIKIRNPFKKAVPSTSKKVTKAGKRSDSAKKEDYSIDADILLAFFRSDPAINAATWVTVDNIVPGYDIEPIDDSSEAEREVEEATQALEKDNWMQEMTNIAANGVVFSNCYQEAHPFFAEGKRAIKTYVIDTPTIKIELQENGEVKSYDQWIDGKKVASLDPEEVVHYKLNPFGDRDKGMSVVEACLFSAAVRKFIDKYNGSIFENHKPRGIWNFSTEMDNDTYEDNVDLIIESKNKPNKDIFLRGEKDMIGFQSFIDQQDTAFREAYQDARDEILMAMRVPKFLLIGGSNKAGGDVELQNFDRMIISKQTYYNKTITEEILHKQMGFTKVRLVLQKANRRDEIRELEIMQKMSGVVTMNEARVQIGLPELDEDEFPQANQIWTAGAGSNPANGVERVDGQRDAEEPPKGFKKAIDQKKNKEIALKPVSLTTEAKTISPFTKWIKDLKSVAPKAIKESGIYKKQIDPKDISNALFAAVTTDALANDFVQSIRGQFFAGMDQIGKPLGKNFQPNPEEMKFLEDYNFDQVKDLSDKTQTRLKNILRRGLLDGKSTAAVTKDVMNELDLTQRNAETLARTELNRVNSNGALNAVEQSGLDAEKYLLVTRDDRTSPISKAFDAKYGTPEKAIPINKTFKITLKGKTYEGKAPPFHPNDRDTPIFIFK